MTYSVDAFLAKDLLAIGTSGWFGISHWAVVSSTLVLFVKTLLLANIGIIHLNHTLLTEGLALLTSEYFSILFNGAAILWALIVDEFAQIQFHADLVESISFTAFLTNRLGLGYFYSQINL